MCFSFTRGNKAGGIVRQGLLGRVIDCVVTHAIALSIH